MYTPNTRRVTYNNIPCYSKNKNTFTMGFSNINICIIFSLLQMKHVNNAGTKSNTVGCKLTSLQSKRCKGTIYFSVLQILCQNLTRIGLCCVHSLLLIKVIKHLGFIQSHVWKNRRRIFIDMIYRTSYKQHRIVYEFHSRRYS